MILINEVERCRIVYESHFEDVLKFTGSQEQAVESCTHYYLDGKPVRKGYTALKLGPTITKRATVTAR